MKGMGNLSTAHDSHWDTKVTLAGGNEIEIIEAQMTVLVALL